MENATKTTLTNVSGQMGHVLNNATSKFVAHSITVEVADVK